MAPAELSERIAALVAEHGVGDQSDSAASVAGAVSYGAGGSEKNPGLLRRHAFLGARFDAGLAWVHFPEGRGGSALPRTEQIGVEAEFARLGAPPTAQADNVIGYGMAAPTILEFGTDEQRDRLLRPIFTGEEIWCQLFSEPGAGSDLAAVATRAIRDGDDWIVSGQKVWTSFAHTAKWAILLARTDPDVPKHRGLTYFIADMTAPGIEVRPLRQITGEAEFNEVFFTDVRIPDSARLGDEGNGWAVAQGTLMNERMAISGGAARESGMVGLLAELWRSRPELRRTALHDRLMRLWVEAEVYRFSCDRQRQQLIAGRPGPDGSGSKVTFAQLQQDSTALELELLGAQGLHHEDWSLRRPTESNWLAGGATHRYLRAKGNSIEGGTSEILLNVIAERVLGLPREPRSDSTLPWKDLPR
ncbi:MAG: acyl-CoA dehydrogenase family protein [Pseudonocardiales bacterium]|nr:acyl-CoA dehydrogenase family protein [Pseudonocardiales bacterium]